MTTFLVPMESIFTLINDLANQTVSTAQIVVIAFAVVAFVVLSALKGFKGGSMLILFIICSFFVWAVFNMDMGKTTVDDTIGGGSNPAPAAPTNQAP